MKRVRKICVFTGGRAEYGILKPLLDEIKKDLGLHLQIIVSGMHLSREFGLTFKEIEKDGFSCNEKIEIILSSDTPVSICKSMGLGMISFSEALQRLSPDILVILGDRFESMALATSALVSRIPIAHIQGGELTLGAIDDQFRHAISKMSFLHFVYTNSYRNRVIQLGENPNRVFNYGALNVDAMKKIKVLSKSRLQKKLGLDLDSRLLLVTFHPSTLEKNTSGRQFSELLMAIDEFKNVKIIFTKTNADTEGRVINEKIDKYVKHNPEKSVSFKSLGQMLYLSTLRYTSAVVGNSSSGIIETPTFYVPTVNIGDREKGRIRADNVIDCKPKKKEIKKSLEKALSPEFKKSLENMYQPYEKKNTSKNIVNTIKKFPLPNSIKKEFFDLQMNRENEPAK